MFAIGWNALLRRSEIVALRFEDLEVDDDGWGTLQIRASKTDQGGEGAVLALEPFVVQTLKEWLIAGEINHGFLFRRLERNGRPGADPVGAREVAEAFKRIAQELGVKGNIAGHSARIGGAHDLVAEGESLASIIQIGRWTSPAMPALYTRKLSAISAAKARSVRRRRGV
jgi:integrase